MALFTVIYRPETGLSAETVDADDVRTEVGGQVVLRRSVLVVGQPREVAVPSGEGDADSRSAGPARLCHDVQAGGARVARLRRRARWTRPGACGRGGSMPGRPGLPQALACPSSGVQARVGVSLSETSARSRSSSRGNRAPCVRTSRTTESARAAPSAALAAEARIVSTRLCVRGWRRLSPRGT